MVIVFKESDDEEQFDLDSVGSRHNRKDLRNIEVVPPSQKQSSPSSKQKHTNPTTAGTYHFSFLVDIICIVRPIPSATNSGAVAYRVAIAVKNGIRNFAPLDFPVVLQRDDASRDLLLLKCMMSYSGSLPWKNTRPYIELD